MKEGSEMKKTLISAMLAIGLAPAATLAYTIQINNGNVYDVTSVSGGANNIVYQGTLVGTGGGANTAPVIGQTAFTIIEPNQAAATITASDPGDIVTFSIVGGANANLFSINAASGALTFNSASVDGSYSVSVRATDDDNAPLSDTETISITVSPNGGGGNCGTMPANTNLNTGFPLSWSTASPSTKLILGTTVTEAIPFSTPNTTAHTGSTSFAAASGTTTIGREMWISECPGGAAFIPPGYNPNNAFGAPNPCTKLGSQNGTIPWSQASLTGFAVLQKCGLSPNQPYYLNIKNTSCTSGACNVYLSVNID